MDIFSLLDEIQTIARNGLHYTSDTYDRERYERLMGLTTETYGELLAVPHAKVRARFLNELGYITPKVGVDAAIFNTSGEILLMERADGSGWCLPCGWIEPNEKPVEAVSREVREETGLEVKAQQLVGVFTRLPSGKNGPHTAIAVVHLCEIVGGELTLSHEGLDLRYWPIAEVQDWHATHKKYARAAHKMWQSEQLLPAISD
ncbi:MAG: NUDIX hydrolase N-terminal domain-containing protein [Anaerolineae bacterium]|nr:NUDIX hydrolase N-terminal domain-containing protein [Anaerolineae bacterium]